MTEPITLAEAKLHLRLDPDVAHPDDTLIASLITAARIHCENFSGRTYMTTTRHLYLDAFPRGEIRLPYPPIQSVTSVEYKASSGAPAAVPTANYVVDIVSEPGRIALAYGASWPSTYPEINAVHITYVAGYGAADDVPENVKAAIKLKLTALYERRGDEERSFVTDILEDAIQALLTPDRIWPL